MYFPSSKIFKYYLESDIYLNLSRIESFGITFVEALSCNLPIITFKTKGANEIVRNGYNGFKIKNNNYKKFIDYLNFFKNNTKYFKNKPYLSSKKYDLDHLVKQYVKIYTQSAK
jgi:glycosyltransferase involved in cell wall biosynthesis